MVFICQSVETNEAAIVASVKLDELLRVGIALGTETERLGSVKE